MIKIFMKLMKMMGITSFIDDVICMYKQLSKTI
jgi:hypothetical protein